MYMWMLKVEDFQQAMCSNLSCGWFDQTFLGFVPMLKGIILHVFE